MNQREMRATIDRLSETSRALEALMRIPSADIERMIRLLSDQKSVSALVNLLLNVQELKSPSLGAVKPAGKAPAGSKPDPKDIEIALRKLFDDRDQFPTVAAIARFVDRVLGIKLAHNKVSRQRFVDKVVHSVNRSPKALAKIQQTSQRGSVDPKDEAYRTLYRFIRRNGSR